VGDGRRKEKEARGAGSGSEIVSRFRQRHSRLFFVFIPHKGHDGHLSPTPLNGLLARLLTTPPLGAARHLQTSNSFTTSCRRTTIALNGLHPHLPALLLLLHQTPLLRCQSRYTRLRWPILAQELGAQHRCEHSASLYYGARSDFIAVLHTCTTVASRVAANARVLPHARRSLRHRRFK